MTAEWWSSSYGALCLTGAVPAEIGQLASLVQQADEERRSGSSRR